MLVRLAEIDGRIDDIDKALVQHFPEYNALISFEPLSIPDVQAQLHDGEVLILFLDTPHLAQTPEETFIWAVSKTGSRWVRSDLGTEAVKKLVFSLRCGLDESYWMDASDWPEATDDAKRHKNYQIARREACKRLTGADNTDALPSFDVAKAYQLHAALFGEIADLLKNADGSGKQLLIVPSGLLTRLPFQVLVTAMPLSGAGPVAYRTAAWFARDNAITVLPGVSSLKSLRLLAKDSGASKPFIGFGNPLLDGRDASFAPLAKVARERQQCPKEQLNTPGPIAARGGITPLLQQNHITDVAFVRAQTPLPETADELCAVAQDFGAGYGDIFLGASASETAVKSLSASGALAQYRTVEFATHGALAGEMNGDAEPGLILTPPEQGTEDDDGYLSVSEIAGLKLDADWVVLSACNTAAADSEGSEAFSGLARAFFYAGARSLLVSQWSVDSNATVKLVTRAADELRADPKIGRAEAVRRSELALIDQGGSYAHPAIWAPFVVVGEGGSATGSNDASAALTDPRRSLPRQKSPSASFAPPTESKKALKAKPRVGKTEPNADDWITSVH